MSKQALLLTNNFEVLRFVSERKILKLLFCDVPKVEVISEWEDDICWTSGKIKLPAIIRLNYPIVRVFHHTSFSRSILIKRDENRCQYCNKKLIPSQITIDHLLPRSRGGKNNFLNCVVACKDCNIYKANRTPEEAGMKLLRKPSHPSFLGDNLKETQDFWHKEWDQFLNR